MGRRTKLTPEMQAEIVTVIQAGNYASVAAQYVGINETTFWLWMKKGEEGTKPVYVEFYKAVKNAQSAAEVRNVALIERAAQESWQAAAWWLERTQYQRWGRKERQEITGDKGGPVTIRVVYDDPLPDNEGDSSSLQ